MHDDMSDIRSFYNQGDPAAENSRLSRHQLEHDITWRYLETYLSPHDRILEVGAGTGGYTMGLVRRGHYVTAVDFSGNLLAECKRRVEEGKMSDRVVHVIADVRDLPLSRRAGYDAVLLMGPLYHLAEEADRDLALSQCFVHLKPGGFMFSALVSRFGIMGALLKQSPQLIEDREQIRSILEYGREPRNHPKGRWRGYYATVDEIALLHERAGLQTILLAGAEPAISADDESYNLLEGTQRELWLDLLLKLSQEPSMVAGSRHLLYIGRKPAR